MQVLKSLAVVVSVVFFFSCATEGAGGRLSERPLFYGHGAGATVTQSLNGAKQDILKQVIEILLSSEVRAAKHEELDRLFYSTNQPNGYFFQETLVTLSQGKADDEFFYFIGLRVDLNAVIRTLEGNSIYGGMVVPGATVQLADGEPPAAAPGPRAQTAQTAKAELEEPPRLSQGASGGLTPEQQAVIGAYIDTLTFLTYFDDEADVDPFLMKAAAGIANKYLAENGVNLIDLDTVEKIKRDQELAYEARTGETVSLIQWIAQKLNADIYVEIDAETSSETDDGKYYGQANITLKFFDSSTAGLLASVPYRSPKTFSSSSELDALNNAIQSSVYQAMPAALEQVYGRMEKAAVDGIPYQLIILSTPDSRLMRDFMREVQERVESIQIVSQSLEETRYRVYLIGAIEDLQDIVFDTADFIPALRNLELVYLRGKSITFASGL